MYAMDIDKAEKELLENDDLSPRSRRKLTDLAEADFGEWMTHVRGGLIQAIHRMGTMSEEEKATSPHVAVLRQIMPTMIRPGDLDSSVHIPPLHRQRDLETQIADNEAARDRFWRIYHRLRGKKRRLLAREEVKAAADLFLEENEAIVKKERDDWFRSQVKASFAEKMFSKDLDVK